MRAATVVACFILLVIAPLHCRPTQWPDHARIAIVLRADSVWSKMSLSATSTFECLYFWLTVRKFLRRDEKCSLAITYVVRPSVTLMTTWLGARIAWNLAAINQADHLTASNRFIYSWSAGVNSDQSRSCLCVNITISLKNPIFACAPSWMSGTSDE